MEGRERSASRILAATIYAIAAVLVVAVPAGYYALQSADPSVLGRALLVFGVTLVACVAGIAGIHLGPLRKVRGIEDELRFRAEHLSLIHI